MTLGLDDRKLETEWKGIVAEIDVAGSEDGAVNFGPWQWRNRRAAEDMLYKTRKEEFKPIGKEAQSRVCAEAEDKITRGTKKLRFVRCRVGVGVKSQMAKSRGQHQNS